MRIFSDRADAGKQLAQILQHYCDKPNSIVIGLPRGGVVTAFEVAQALRLPLDIVVPRKVGAPFNPELALGALTVDGSIIWNQNAHKLVDLKSPEVTAVIAQERAEAARRLAKYRAGRSPLDLSGKTVLLVDDGIATGATMRAAIDQVKKKGAAQVVVATPVVAADTLKALDADEIVAVDIPQQMFGIGQFYQNFAQTTDDKVVAALASSI